MLRREIDFFLGDARELFAEAESLQLSQRPPDREQCGCDGNGEARDEAERLDRENQARRPDRADPPVRQAVDHQLGVRDGGGCPEDRSRHHDDQPFEQHLSLNLLGREADRAEQSKIADSLLDP